VARCAAACSTAGIPCNGTAPIASSPAAAVLYANAQGHFLAEGQVNGRTTRFIVDTGATSVTLSSVEARRMGIAYLAGKKGAVRTANGTVPAYEVKLDTVRLGDITLYGVDAIVLEGDKLPLPLLGMSFLNRLDMKREGEAMTLTKRY
jgi:aspartyl protease family protein